MKIAITYNEGEVFGHFGHTEQFIIYMIEENKIINSIILDTNGSGHSALGKLLKENNVDVLICGGIGEGAKMFLADAKIKVYPGVEGKVQDVINEFINGTLVYNENIKCNHHHEGEEYHDCNHPCDNDHRCNH